MNYETCYDNVFKCIIILLAYILTLIYCAIVQFLRNFPRSMHHLFYFYLFSQVFVSVVKFFLKDCKLKLKCKNCLSIILKVISLKK